MLFYLCKREYILLALPLFCLRFTFHKILAHMCSLYLLFVWHLCAAIYLSKIPPSTLQYGFSPYSTTPLSPTNTLTYLVKAIRLDSFDLQCPYIELNDGQCRSLAVFYTDLLLYSCPRLDSWSSVSSVDAREIDVIC